MWLQQVIVEVTVQFSANTRINTKMQARETHTEHRRTCASQTVANKKPTKKQKSKGCPNPKKRNVTKVDKESLSVWQNLKIKFEHFEFWNDICTRGRPFYKLFNDTGLHQIALQNFFQFMLIYAKVFEPIKFCHLPISKYPKLIFLWWVDSKI